MLTSNKTQNRARLRVALTLALVGLIGAVVLVLAPSRRASAQSVAASWSYTGNLNTSRYGHTATLLQNGKVLVFGSSEVPAPNSAELYDPTSGTWSITGSLNMALSGRTATLLLNGKVLAAGGVGLDNSGFPGSFNSAELYDPATGTWSITGNLNKGRANHTATLLPNGKVLVAGGQASSVPLNYFEELRSAELYDPATGTWSYTGNLGIRLDGHTATSLPDGKVLIAGGRTFDAPGNLNYFAPNSEIEIYDPASASWNRAGNLIRVRSGRTATALPDGKVLFAGGDGLNSAELCDPATGTCSSTGTLQVVRFGHTATLLQDGKVLVAGGYNFESDPEGTVLDTAELYDPATGTWSMTASLNIGRYAHTATLLPNGKVLVAGPGNTAELYDPGANSTINQIDDAQFFVRQQYLDFLNREPEAAGLQFYLNILNGCAPTDTECLKYTRGALSANFFRSPEFQQKGSFVMYLYLISIGQRPATVAEVQNPDQYKLDRPHYTEFFTDLQSISDPNNDKAIVSARKDALTVAWLQRGEAQQNLPSSLTNQQFVQKLETIAGVSLSNESSLIAALNNQSQTRAQVLRAVAESPEVNTKYYRQAFVTMEYFGYLRRDPEVCIGSSDVANCGYIFHNSRFQLAADPDFLENTIVRGFIESPEYRQRFGP